MSKKNRFFDNEFERDEDWGEYRKVSKKKHKHREEKDWRFDKRKNYQEDYNEYDDEEYDDRKTRNW